MAEPQIGDAYRRRIVELETQRDHYKQQVEQIRRNQARRVRNADARVEAAEQRLEAVREETERYEAGGIDAHDTLMNISSLLDQTDD